MSVWGVYMRVQVPKGPEEGVRSPRAGITGVSEPPNTGAGNGAQIFCGKCS